MDIQFVCNECGGSNVKKLMYVNPNNLEVDTKLSQWIDPQTHWCTDCNTEITITEKVS